MGFLVGRRWLLQRSSGSRGSFTTEWSLRMTASDQLAQQGADDDSLATDQDHLDLREEEREDG